jgi:hypothetical protein
VLLACQPGVLPEAVLNDRAVGGRIVTLGDIDTAVRNALANRRGYLPVPPIPRVTRIGAKMERGLCADTSIERAGLLRKDYQQYWRDRGSGDPLASLAQARLRRVLHRISDEATDAVSRPQGEPWGADLWRELNARVDALPAGEWPGDLDADLRLGGACDLVAQCMVWFSERFEFQGTVIALGIPGVETATIHPTNYLPLLNKEPYQTFSKGGGIITAVQVAYWISLLAVALRRGDTYYPTLLIIDTPQLALNNQEQITIPLYQRLVNQADASRGQVQFIIADNQLPIDYRQGYAQKDFSYDHPTVSTIPHPGPAAVRPINSE